MEKEVVSNSSSLIFLAKLDIINLAKNLFSAILIPKQVFNEIFNKRMLENILLEKEVGKFLIVRNVKNVKDFSLDIGEQAAISLCLQEKKKTFLSDDKKARILARNLEIEVIGVLGILLWNLKNNKIKKDVCLNLLNKLMNKGYYMSPELYSDIFSEINDT